LRSHLRILGRYFKRTSIFNGDQNEIQNETKSDPFPFVMEIGSFPGATRVDGRGIDRRGIDTRALVENMLSLMTNERALVKGFLFRNQKRFSERFLFRNQSMEGTLPGTFPIGKSSSSLFAYSSSLNSLLK
jgi:hypothetical protein